MIDDEEVDRKFCNYCTKDFSPKTSSVNLKNHLREHELFKKRKYRIYSEISPWSYARTKLKKAKISFANKPMGLFPNFASFH
jgi:hypothetical protein